MKSLVKLVSFTIVLFLIYLGTLHAQIERWVYKYDGSTSISDYAYDLIYGVDGNIYAVGESYNDGTSYDFTVVGLTPLGNERWVYILDGPTNEWDAAYSLVSDGDSTLYVVGRNKSNTEDDVAVVALTHSGSEKWVYLYDGPSHLWDEGHEIAYGAGNIYIGGFSTDSGTPNHYDMLVICLDSVGNEQWIYRHNGTSNYNDEVSSILVGQDSNIYISGWIYDSVTSSDFTVVSLDTAGNERWIYKYNAWENYEDKAYALIYGSDGNIYAAGYSSSSEVFPRLTVISLTPSGNEHWVYRYGNWGLSCYAKSIAYGFDNRVYVAGTRDTLGTVDLLVICLDTLGNEQWVYIYDGPGTYVDWANAIIHGSDGNIYVAGTSWGGATQFDYLVISLDSSGTERWVYRYNADVSVDEAYSIVYGQDDFIYTCGKSYHRDTSDDFTVISLIPEIGIVEEKVRIKDIVCNSFQIEPNPFHNIIKIKFNLTEKVINTELKIYDVTGRVLKTFSQLTGQIVWDGTDDTGRQVSEGVYFVQLRTSSFKATKKVILLK